MGNTKGAHFKDQFGRNQFANLEVGHDNLVGSFSVIRLQGPPTTTSLVKVLDPRIYDDYSDIGEAVRKISQDHPHVTSLLFVSENRQNPEFYNLAFEYGEPQNTFIYEEPVLWSFIEQVVEGLLFVESQGYHYPVLSKQYLLLTGKGVVKLLNPYAFSDFMKEILQIYLNPQNPMSNRRSYFMMQVARNIKELGVMVATLVSNCNEYQLKTDPGYANKVVDAISAKFSKNLVAAMRALIQNNGQLKSFSDVKALIQKLKAAAPEAVGAPTGPAGFGGSFARDQGPMTPLAKQPGQGFSSTSPVGSTQPPMTPKADAGTAFKSVGSARDNPTGGQPFYPEDQRKLRIFDNPSGGSFKQYPARQDASQYQVFQLDPNLAQKYQTNPAASYGQGPSLFESQPPQERLSSLPNIPLPNMPPPQPPLQPALQRSPSPPTNQFDPQQGNPGAFRQTQPVSTVQSAPPQLLNPKPMGLMNDPQQMGANLPQLPTPQTTRVQSTPGNPLLFNIQNTFGSAKAIDSVNQPQGQPTGQPAMAYQPLQGVPPPSPQSNPPPPTDSQPELIPEEDEHLDQENLAFQKRQSLNSEPIIHSNDKPDYLFVNGADPHNVNVTSYFQRRESGIGVGLLDGQMNHPTFRKNDFFDTDEGVEDSPPANKLGPINPSSEFRQDPLGASQVEPPPSGWNLNPTVISQKQEEPREQREARESYGASQSQIQNNFPPSQPMVGVSPSLNNSQTGFPMQPAGGMGQPPQPVFQQPQVPPPQPPQQPERQKMIVKINIRWLPDEKRHQKVVEYEDKTTEELPFTEEEKLKFISGPAQPPQPAPQQPQMPLQPPSPLLPTGPIGFNQPQSPSIQQPPPHQQSLYQPPQKPAPYQPPTQTRPINAYPPQQPPSPSQPGYQPFPPNFANDPMAKASHIVHYNVPTESPTEHSLGVSALIQNCATLCLFPEGSENSVLLFRSRPLNLNNRFADVGCVVNRRDALAPSCYHNVEQPRLTGSSIFGKREGSTGELTHITKEEYHKPVSMDNLPRLDAKPAMPTSLSKPSTILSSNARVIKKI